MLKIYLLFILLTAGLIAKAQTADEIYDKYAEFNLARLQDEQDKAMDLGTQLLADTAKLPQKVLPNFYNSMAKLYEDYNQSEKAIAFYKRVVASKPNYYVAHRALGYLFIKDAADKPVNEVDAAYIKKVNNALPHLEKAQACDPDESTLKLIKVLYHNIKGDKSISTLPARLNKLKKNCEDILSDQ